MKPIKYCICEGNPKFKENRKKWCTLFNDAVIIKRRMEREYGGKWDIYGQFRSQQHSGYDYIKVPYEKYDVNEEERFI